MNYEYSKFCHAAQLEQEINNSNILVDISSVSTSGSHTFIAFLSELSNNDKTLLDSLVVAHVPVYPEPIDSIKPVSIQNVEVDDQGRQILRVAAASKGWAYVARSIEFETAAIGSLYSTNYQNTSNTDVSIKFYNSSNTEVTSVEDESTIVKTEVIIKPQFDYEIISGNLHQIDQPTSDLRIWVLGGIIELGGAYVKEFAQGLNMRFIGPDEHFNTDGRASKYMKKDIPGVPYQANQLKIIVRHVAGYKHKLMMVLEYFRQ